MIVPTKSNRFTAYTTLVDYSIILIDEDEVKSVKYYLDSIIPDLSNYLIEGENDNGTCFPLDFIPKTYKDCWESIMTFIQESEALEYTDNIVEKLLKQYAEAYFKKLKTKEKNLIDDLLYDDILMGTEYNGYVYSLNDILNGNLIELDDYIFLLSKTNKGIEMMFYDDKYIDHFKDNCRLVSNYINNVLFCKIFKLKFECIIAPDYIVKELIYRELIAVCDSPVIEYNIKYSFAR